MTIFLWTNWGLLGWIVMPTMSQTPLVTSLMLLSLNESRSPQLHSFQFEMKCYAKQAQMSVIFWCAHTFGFMVHNHWIKITHAHLRDASYGAAECSVVSRYNWAAHKRMCELGGLREIMLFVGRMLIHNACKYQEIWVSHMGIRKTLKYKQSNHRILAEVFLLSTLHTSEKAWESSVSGH